MAGHRAFSFVAPFVARDAFQHGGVQYAAGAPFPWRDLGLSERQVWNLWAARKIDNASTHTDLDLGRMSPEQIAEIEATTAPPAPSAELSPAFATANMRLPPDHVATMRVTTDPPRAPAPSSKRHHRR